ncbi:hypothetical protein LSH36_1g12019 [Paralvinella palmiformis]|uniref:Nucleolus and neural progenitor protein-like N-terminal domain-containing protein n=1 Tax=Paralvinella palmiformis TaxID=53620 RepID=A0AAD9NJK5_9ANNE|nr:hypothetical protein LSH36_1g12019 [Paralvinella palmiformis]
MEQTWNDYNLKPPPFITIPHDRIQLLKDVNGIPEAFQDVMKRIQQVLNSHHLDSEMFLLTRLIYKIRNNLGGQKVTNGLKMVKKCLEHWNRLNIMEILEPLRDDMKKLSSLTTSDTVYIQSALCLKYTLHKLMGSAALLGQMSSYSMQTFICAYENLLLGLFIPKMLTFMALMSRIRTLCLLIMQSLFQCYKSAYQLLLQVYGIQVCVDSLPDNLEWWIIDQGHCTSLTSHLDKKIAKSSQNLDDFLSKYVTEHNNAFMEDVLDDAEVLGHQQDVSQIKSKCDQENVDEQKHVECGLDKSAISSSVDEPKCKETVVKCTPLLVEDLGTRVNRTEQCHSGQNHDRQCLTTAISLLPKCTSNKKLFGLLKSISTNIPQARRKRFMKLLQELETMPKIQTKGPYKAVSKKNVAVNRKKIASFLQLLVEDPEYVVLVEDAPKQINCNDLALGVPEAKKNYKRSEYELLKNSWRRLKKLRKTLNTKIHSTKRFLELLLKIRADAKIYQPRIYKKIVKDIRLERSTKEKLREDVRSLLNKIITAMEEKLKQ